MGDTDHRDSAVVVGDLRGRLERRDEFYNLGRATGPSRLPSEQKRGAAEQSHDYG